MTFQLQRLIGRGSTRRRLPALATTAALVAGATVSVLLAAAPPATADTQPPGISPIAQRDATTVTADALPTVQIDGVVWSTAVNGNTVYAGGEFTTARPAGAAAGSQTTPRNNLLAFDITTGNLITSFAPSLNAQVKTVAVSPDGSRVYVGGSFTQANGVTRNRIAAYSTSTGALISSFAPSFNLTVNAIAVTNTAVFVGGSFSAVNGVSRARLAAIDPTTGALLSWAPSADATVNALAVAPGQNLVVVGGQFASINGGAAYGLGAVDNTGTLQPFPANQVIQDAGANAAILGLSTDGRAIYTSSYVYGSGGNFEGNASISPTGTINWLADCHGDSYGTFGTQNVLYSVSHQHYCSNIGGFPDTNPRNRWYRTTAFTQSVTGTVQPNGEAGGGYGNFAGQPSPSLINWTPDLTAGTYTGQSQAAWTVTGNSQYVVEGGEFPKVNLSGQQGLVRFAVPSIAPNKQGPRLSGVQLNLTATTRSAQSVRLSWGSDWDRDDRDLSYAVLRNNVVVKTFTATAESWNLPTIGYIDTGLTPGATYSYKIRVSDPNNNQATSSALSVTMPATGPPPDGAYVQDVLSQGAQHFWRLDQAPGATTNIDYAGFDDLTLNSGVAGGAAGAINDGDTASSFDGSSAGFGSTSAPVVGPNVFTEQAWFKTTTTAGGKIVGFGDQPTGTSSNYDRHIYMNPNGQVTFGVYNNASYTITTPAALNDGNWHQVVGMLSPAGMAFYVDGALVGTNTGTTVGQPYSGYWRVGGDSSWNGSNFFAGQIDDVSIYPTPLTLAQVRQQFLDSGRTRVGFTPPSDAYGSTVWNDSPYLYYRLDETSGTTAVDVSGNSADGAYAGGYTQGQPSTVTTGGTSVAFDGNSGTIASKAAIAGPSVYSEEAWFNTTSTSGGKIIGFGDQQSGYSGSYDRHVYMLGDGRLVFGTYTGQTNLAVSTNSYNDGAWHQVVATQGPDGMILYVDGQSVATNPQTSAQPYNGYWRIGGDNLNGWPGAGNAFFNGRIDEVSVYLSELTPAQVQAHYAASPTAPALPPVASFTSSVSGGTASFDASGSTAPSGTIAGYAWNFGDGSTGTGVTPTHAYAATGTYPVTLTVTDSKGATSTASRQVSVTVNRQPVASFAATTSGLTASLDATGSSDPDGDALSYAWNFGDSTTGTGVTTSHAYSTGGTYTVTLTVTDPGGLSSTASSTVTVVQPNRAPTAAFTSGIAGLTASLDATGSSDPDGDALTYAWNFGDSTTGTGVTTSHAYSVPGTYTVTLTVTDPGGLSSTTSSSVTVVQPNRRPTASFTSGVTGLTASLNASGSSDPDGDALTYAWNFGDSTTGTGVTTTHAYAAGGTYTVTLTVTDPGGLSSTATSTVTIASPNRRPVASFTASPSNLVVAFDGRASVDPDGDALTYAWNFGDSTTGTGATTSHTYATAGTYTVTLTVTDPSGATGSSTTSVPVTDVLAADTFTRSVTGGWGSADTGGAWTVTNGASNFGVNGSAGVLTLGTAGAAGPTAVLKGVSATNVEQLVDVTTNKLATGSGTSVVLIARRTASGEYRLKLKWLADGTLHLNWSKVVAGKETVPSEVVVKNVTYAAGDQFRMRFRVVGDGTTTTINGRVWKVGTTEPTTWQINGTDTEPSLQGPGNVGLIAGLGSNATNAPVTVGVDNYTVRRV